MKDEDVYLDHVAIAVTSLDVAVKVYEDLGLTFSAEREEVPSQQVRTAFASIDHRAHIELLEPLNGKGPIADFIQKKGQGIHHLSFRVEDIVKKNQELLDRGYQLIYPKPVVGANNCLVNFIHPKSTGGVLIEISQKLEI